MNKQIAKARRQIKAQQEAKREAVLDERKSLQRLFPASFVPDISVFSNGKVEVMFRLTYSQAQNLAKLLKNPKL